jgi:hypothetical protein
MIVAMDRFLKGLLTNAKATVAAVGVLSDVTMGLYTNPIALVPTLALADLIVPTNPSYDQQALTWNTTPFKEPDGDWAIFTPLISWTIATGEDPITAVGWFVALGSGAGLLLAEQFPSAINIPSPDYAFSITAVVNAGTHGWGEGIVVR